MHKRKRKSGEAKKSEAAVSKQKSNINAVNVAAVENDNDDNQQDDNDDYLHMYDDEEGGTRVGDIYIPPPIKPYCLTESKGPRLIIKKIVNENFKSFAGEVNIGPFHQRFTAIIGPNGSGKSNVIDSMLFVFGFRAQKLRCKKLSSLVHNSAKFPKQEMCKVSIHFKKIIDKQDGGFEDVPDSEFVVSRTAFRDDSSYYLINDRRSKLKDVAKLLKNHGIDLDHNRFLILQGDVESIALMKPKSLVPKDYGMLEYLEDIIGTTRYKQPLEQINNRVETLTEERTEKHNRCKLAEREMKDLEDPYKEAINFLEKENVFKRAQNLKYQKTLSGLNHKLEECGKEMDGIQKELQEHDDKVNELSKEKEEKEKLIKDSNINYSKLCKTKEEMEQNLTKASNNYTETQNTMVAMNKRRKQNQEQIQKLESKLEDLIKVPKQNEGEIHDCEKKVEKLTTDKKKYEEELQKNYALIEDQTRPHIEKREKLETILIDKKKIAGEAKAELSLAESELQILQHDETNEKRKYESLKSSLEDSKKELEQKQNEFDEIKASIPKMKDEMNKKTIELMDCKKEQKTLHNQLLTYKAEIAEKKSNMQMATSNNKVLDSLMKQKYEGNIPGILGRLGDLGGIDAKYDVAISTACGRLDNIVCDTVDTAQACIEHLKRHDVGRASFIALEKVQHLQQQCRSKINTPENVPRLFDLVRVEDERVLPAFYFALGNTLVANDLDQGTRIAYGRVRYRVVTLRGDLIETSGTMSGGGTIQMRGKMGQKVKTQTNKRSLDTTSVHGKKDLEQLELKTEKVQNRINYLQEQEGQLEREINQLKNELINKEKEEKKLTVTIRSFTEQLPRIEVMLKSQKERMDKTHADQTKVKQLEKKINTMRKNTENSEKIANEISEKISQINNEISKIHGDKIKSVQDKINSITKQMKNLNANISKLKVEITTSERNVQKTKKQIEDLKEEIKNAEKNLLELKDKRIEYEQEQKELEQKITVIKQEIEQIEKSTSNVRSEISAIQKMENEMKLKRVEIEEKMLQMKNKITDIKRHLPSINKKLSELKLNEIPGRVVNETDMILKTYTEEELNTYKLQDLEYECKELEEDLRSKKPNFSAISEYLNKRETYLQRVKILENVTSQRNEMRQLYEDVKKKRYTEFMHGFTIITKKLKEMYQMITQGGDAELELVDSMDPFNEGVSFSVRPPKKTWKNISNLSGGEKTLSSLALVFALHYYKPSPLYFMDEIDAALDFKNVSIVAHYIKERTKNSQFIIISLRPNMFELSDYIVGIYKVNDCTSALAVRNCPPDTTETIIQQTEKENDQNNHQSQLQQQIHINNNQNEKEQQIILDTSKEQQLETDEQNESIRQQLANQTEIELDETNLEKDQTEIELDQTELESEQQEKEQEKQQSEEEDQQQQQQEQQQNEDKQ